LKGLTHSESRLLFPHPGRECTDAALHNASVRRKWRENRVKPGFQRLLALASPNKNRSSRAHFRGDSRIF
jgi:hypothetical protein